MTTSTDTIELPAPTETCTTRELKRKVTAIRRLMHRRNALVAKLAAEVAELKERQAPRRNNQSNIERLIFEIMGLIAPYARANQEKLTGPDSRSVTLPSGVLAWRKVPQTIVVDEADVSRVIHQLKRRGLRDCVRRPKEVIDLVALMRRLPEVKKLIAEGQLKGVRLSDENAETLILTPEGSSAYVRESQDGEVTIETPKTRSRKTPE